MSLDHDLERYFQRRSADLALPHADVATIRRQAHHHRRRQVAVRGGLAVALLAGGALLFVDRGRQPDAEEQAAEGAAPAPSPLDWTSVEVEAGIRMFASPAVSDGGAVYSLSTAPGPEDPGAPGEPRHVYRSTDGGEWEEVAAPDGMFATSLGAADGSLYAVGTTAAGGEVDGVALARSTDGGAGWSTAGLPLDLDGLAPGFPGTVHVTDVGVARSGATTVVTVSVRGGVDPALVLTDVPDPEEWYEDDQGFGSMAPCGDDRGQAETTTAPAATATEAPEATTAPDPEAPPGTTPSGATLPDCPTQHRTWAELGLTDDQVALARGRTYVLAAVDDGPFATTAVLEGIGGFEGELMVADDGWWYVGPAAPGADGIRTVEARHSVDGAAWTAVPIARGGLLIGAGLVAGRPVALTADSSDSVATSTRIAEGGSVDSVGINATLDLPSGRGLAVQAAGIGPLGLAAVLSTGRGGERPELVVAHSLDGVTFSATPLPAADPGMDRSVLGITVTADAIKVRTGHWDQDRGEMSRPSEQRLFVGTPR